MLIVGEIVKKAVGFTLVEVLGVIVVLGLIVLIAYPNIMKQVDQAKTQAYEMQIKDIEKAASSFALKNATLMPIQEGESLTLFLRDLKRVGLIDRDLKNSKTKKRFPEDMEIVVTRVGQKYQYQVLDHTGSIIKDTDMSEPTLLLKGLSFEYVEVNTPYVDKGITVLDKSGNIVSHDKILVTPTNIHTSVLHKEYIITYKVTLDGKTYSVTRKVKVRDTTPPEITIPHNTTMAPTTANFDTMEGVSATDNSGERITVTASGSIVTTVPGVYVITYKASDSSGNTRTKKRTITIYHSICPLIRIEGNKPSGVITNQNVKMISKYVATGKDPSEYEFQWQKLVNGEWLDVIGSKANAHEEKNTIRAQYRLSYQYDACNNVTNTWEVYIDKEVPTCSITTSGVVGKNGWYKQTNATVQLNTSDIGSSVSAYGMSTNTTVSYNSSNRVTQGDTKGITYYGHVKDEAGNTGRCQSNVIKVDKTPPSCSIGASGTTGENSWFKSVVSLGLSYTDGAGSGMGNYGLTTNDYTTYNGSPSNSQGDTSGTTWYGYVEDIAGNTGTCSRSVKVDSSAPTCSVNVGGNLVNGWYQDGIAYINLDQYEYGPSGMSDYGLTTNYYTTYNRSTSNSQGDTNGTTWYGYVKDAAGNTGSCSKYVKVESSAPACPTFTANISSNVWTKNDLTLTVYPASGTSSWELYEKVDSGSYSLVNSYSGTSSRSNTFKGTGKKTYKAVVKNASGKSQECSSSEYWIDQNAPTSVKINNPSGGKWVNADFRLTVSANEKRSGIAYFEYGFDGTNYTRWQNSDSTTFETPLFSKERNDTVYVRAVDKVGNVSNPATSKIKLDKTKPYTPTLVADYTKNIGSGNIKVNVYGNCPSKGAVINGSTCSVSSYNLSNSGDACFINRACGGSTESRVALNCRYLKKYACGGTTATAKDNSGGSGIASVVYDGTVYASGCKNSKNQDALSKSTWYAVDNAGNQSEILTVNILNQHAFTQNLLNAFKTDGNKWARISGTSCPTK